MYRLFARQTVIGKYSLKYTIGKEKKAGGKILTPCMNDTCSTDNIPKASEGPKYVNSELVMNDKSIPSNDNVENFFTVPY